MSHHPIIQNARRLLFITPREVFSRHTNNAFLYILHFSVETNQALCQEQEIKSYPTLIAFKGGSKAGAYRGDRSLEALKSFVNTNKVAA